MMFLKSGNTHDLAGNRSGCENNPKLKLHLVVGCAVGEVRERILSMRENRQSIAWKKEVDGWVKDPNGEAMRKGQI